MNYLMKILKRINSLTNNHSNPKTITLSTGEKLKFPKVEFVLRYHVPNQHKDCEAYAHHYHLFFIFYT